MSDSGEEFLGELRLGRQLTTVSQVAARGAVIVLGLLFGLTDQALALLGKVAPLAGLLAALVLGLTLLSVIELFAGSRERGGTYVLVQETLGGLPAFLVGWSILAACVALTGALVREAAALLLSLFSTDLISVTTLAIALLVSLLLVQLFQVLPRWLEMKTVAVLLSGIVVLMLLATLPRFNLAAFRSRPAGEFAVLDHGVAWLSVSYVAFEAMLVSRRQIRNARGIMPRAVLSILVFAGLIFLLVFFLLLGLEASQSADVNSLAETLSTAGFFPTWFVTIIGLLALIAAANACMMTALRQMHGLSQQGALPDVLRRVRRPIPMPLGLFGLFALLGLPSIIVGNFHWLVNVSGSLFLVVLALLNISAVYSQRNEPDRRRSFQVPFAPLIPLIGVAASLILLRSIPLGSLISAAAWLLLGAGYFLVYARGHEAEAQVGEVVFGGKESPEKEEDRYRILVPIGRADERRMTLRFACALANQLNGEVIPLQVICVPDPLAMEEGRRTAQERNELFRWSARLANDIGVPMFPITRLAHSVPEGIIDTAVEEDCNVVLISWYPERNDDEARTSPILDRVAPNVQSDVVVLAYNPARISEMAEDAETQKMGDETGRQDSDEIEGRTFHPARILVPTAGGPHAPLAIQIALLLARQYEATVTSVYVVEPEASEEEISSGEERIEQTIAKMRKHARELPSMDGEEPAFTDIAIEGRIIHSANVVSGIAEAGAEVDLVLMGASEESLIDRVLFGNIPEQVARECPSPVVIVRRFRGLPRMWLQRTWNTIFETLPTLDKQRQIDVYREIHRDARPDVDFFAMIGLSSLIATFGLLQNSSAVIIGAMLVAPLFSPLLGISLSIIQGNVRLLRLAIDSTLKGIALGIGVAILLSVASPLKPVTEEITARTSPNLFDLIVAVASGAAGAYAIAREDVAAALPGVAIAAALVPPLNVIGIGIAVGDLSVAGGASLLLITNLIAIALAGAITFLLLGFRPGARGLREVHLRRGLTTTLILFVLVAIPLGGFFVQSLNSSRRQQSIQENLVQILEVEPNIELVSQDEIRVREDGDGLVVTVPVYTGERITQGFAERLSERLSAEIGRPVTVRVVQLTLVEAYP